MGTHVITFGPGGWARCTCGWGFHADDGEAQFGAADRHLEAPDRCPTCHETALENGVCGECGRIA